MRLALGLGQTRRRTMCWLVDGWVMVRSELVMLARVESKPSVRRMNSSAFRLWVQQQGSRDRGKGVRRRIRRNEQGRAGHSQGTAAPPTGSRCARGRGSVACPRVDAAWIGGLGTPRCAAQVPTSRAQPCAPQ